MAFVRIKKACSFEPFFRADSIGDVIEVSDELAKDMIEAEVAEAVQAPEPTEDRSTTKKK